MTSIDCDGIPPAVLATARAGGTVAAVRSLGRDHIPVEILRSQPLAAAARSRFAAVVHRVPLESDAGFIDRLCRIGQARPGRVLLPTSDQTAWLYAREATRLGACFHSYQPSPDVLAAVLDKARLAETARRAGVAIPDTWAPGAIDEVTALAPGLTYPILIKPRSHIDRLNNHKGQLTHDADALIRAYASMVQLENQAQSQAHHQDIAPPVLQRFVPMGREGVYSVTGFIDRSGTLFTTRVSAKVFLRMQPAGVGVCYESRPPDAGLSDAAYRLCRTAGYFGMFEIEFMHRGPDWVAIDFNPRLFSQVGLDIARGMPLPRLLWLAALGRQDELQQAVQAAVAAAQDAATMVLYDRFTLAAMLAALTVMGRTPRAELDYWRTWRTRHAAHAVDFAWDRRDPWPGIVHAGSELALGFKALPRFLRSVIPSTNDARPGTEAA